MPRKIYPLYSVLLIASFTLAACGGTPATQAPAAIQPSAATQAPATQAPTEQVTIDWWHTTTNDPGQSDWKKMADDYMAAHPNVQIHIRVLTNEDFKTKLTSAIQLGNPPDIFQSWGGGGMKQQVAAGMLKDITAHLDANGGAWRNTFVPGALAVYSYQNKNYGVPWDMGMVGWWYNKRLFTKAGIENPPTTWEDFLSDVKKIRAAGIIPICLGEGDKSPGTYLWSYLALRFGGEAAFDAAYSRTGSFTDPAFVQAGQMLQELVDLDPFQAGYLDATDDQAQADFGNGICAMELSGQWAPSVEAANGFNERGVENLGVFKFPAIEGGVGDVSDVVGGGHGFAIGKNAPPEAIDFVKYLTSAENQKLIASHGTGIPVVKDGNAALTDPNLQADQKALAAAKHFQLYYDQYLPPAMGSVLDDAVQGIFDGTSTPEQAAQTIEDSAKQELK